MPVFNPTTIAGTADQVLANGTVGSPNFGLITLSLPQSIGTSSSPTFTGLTLTGLVSNSFLYSGPGDVLTSTAAPTNGQLLIGSTGAAPVTSTLTAGAGISITNAAGSITIANSNTLPGSNVPGKVVKAEFASSSGTTQMAIDVLPTITSGWQLTSLTVVPTYTTSGYWLTSSFYCDCGSNNRNFSVAVWRTVGGVNTLVGTQSITITTSGRPQTVGISMYDDPATLSSVTYSIRVGMNNTGTSYVNQYVGGESLGGSSSSAFFAQEIY